MSVAEIKASSGECGFKHPIGSSATRVSTACLVQSATLPARTSYPKTSGATGLHILAPIKPELVFPEVRRFAKAVAQEVERRVGDTGQWTRIATQPSASPEYADASAPAGVLCYRVRVANPNGESAYSNVVRVRR